MRCLCRGLLASALFLTASAFSEVRTLTILHTNDLHARISPLENGTTHGNLCAIDSRWSEPTGT